MITMPNEGKLREHLIAATGWAAEQFRRTDFGETFTLVIKVEASAETNEAKLVYQMDHRRNYDSSVEANSLFEATFELLRRMGWKKEHTALQLTWQAAPERSEGGNGAGAPSLEETK